MFLKSEDPHSVYYSRLGVDVGVGVSLSGWNCWAWGDVSFAIPLGAVEAVGAQSLKKGRRSSWSGRSAMGDEMGQEGVAERTQMCTQRKSRRSGRDNSLDRRRKSLSVVSEPWWEEVDSLGCIVF
jgi:hypothetical protein